MYLDIESTHQRINLRTVSGHNRAMRNRITHDKTDRDQTKWRNTAIPDSQDSPPPHPDSSTTAKSDAEMNRMEKTPRNPAGAHPQPCRVSAILHTSGITHRSTSCGKDTEGNTAESKRPEERNTHCHSFLLLPTLIPFSASAEAEKRASRTMWMLHTPATAIR